MEEIQRRLARKVLDLLSESEVWIVDETAFPKAGQHSVGVARQSAFLGPEYNPMAIPRPKPEGL